MSIASDFFPESEPPRKPEVLARHPAEARHAGALPLAENTDNTPIILPPADTTGLQPNRPAEGEVERRLYIPWPEGWEAHVKLGMEKDYCFSKNPGQDYYHLILHGEIYLQHGADRFCLNCAARRGIVTTDRLHWQHRPRKKDSMPL